MRFLTVAGVALCGLSSAFAQPAAPAPAFEVASVKVRGGGGGEGVRKVERGAQSEARGGGADQIVAGPAGVTMTNVRMRAIIVWAFHLQPIQVSGPGWLDNERYDITAKAAGPANIEQLRAMTQTLLAQRFKLAFHRETKEMQAYVVTVAKTGHKLKQSEGEGEMDMKPDVAKLKVNFTHASMAKLSEMLSNPLQGVVVDQTGLEGDWDFSLDITNVMDSRPANMDDAVSMIAQMVKQQLGINIDMKKIPAEVLTVDHVEHVPIEN